MFNAGIRCSRRCRIDWPVCSQNDMARAYSRPEGPQLRPSGQRTLENAAIGYFMVPSARMTEVTMDRAGVEL